MASTDGSAPIDVALVAPTPIITNDPSMVREMAFARIERNAARLRRMFQDRSGYDIYCGRTRKVQEETIRGYVAELNECVSALGQLGWREPPKRKRGA